MASNRNEIYYSSFKYIVVKHLNIPFVVHILVSFLIFKSTKYCTLHTLYYATYDQCDDE